MVKKGWAITLLVGYFMLGLLQFIAVITGMINTLGWFFGIIVAIITSHTPIVGLVFGIIGAVNSWGMSITGAILLFTLPNGYLLIFYFIKNKD